MRREALVRAAGSAELFLAMRGAFTASLAAMSATGYCAGVGDRHMGNIMLHASGRLVPIDFGCTPSCQLLMFSSPLSPMTVSLSGSCNPVSARMCVCGAVHHCCTP